MAATYTVKQVAEILGYSTNSIYSFLKEKRIKGVRVGTGRFRIPQSELNRLLLIAKGQNTAVRPETAPVPDIGIITPHEVHQPFSVLLFGRTHTVTGNIFDWFIGTSAIVSGLALFLFNQTFDIVNVPSTGSILPSVRIFLIGGGVGILLTNFLYDSHRIWHRVFHGVLAVAGIIMTVFLVMIRDIDAVGIYGTLTVVILITMFISLGRVIPFILYLTLLAVAAPVISFVAPGDFHVAAFANVFGVTPFWTGIGLSGISAVFILLLWLGLYWKQALYWFCSYTAAVVYLALAFWFAHHQFWSRAFFFMIIGLTCMYLPSWEDLIGSRNKKAQTLAIGVFGAIMAVVLSGVVVVYITQRNVISTVQRENIQKVDFARTMLETDIQSVKSTILTASINTDLVAAVQEKNAAKLIDVSRIMFESNNSIRRIVIVDKNGTALFLYPFGTFDQQDLSFRDYFIQARDTGKLYVSDVFEALVDQEHRKVVSVAAPLYTTDKKFVGVLVASLNLDAVSARLQKIAVVDRGEYIVVLDSHGKRIMHPVPDFIGTDTEPNDPTLLGIRGKTGVAEGNTYDGVRSLIAYTSIDSLHWAISLKAPYNNVYALSGAANVVMAGFIIGCIVITLLIFQLSYIYKYKSENGGGSP